MHALFTEPYLVAAVGAFGIAVLASVLLAYRQLRSASSREDLNLTRIRAFRGEDYRPMERLLTEADYQFLQRQPGYRPAIGDRLRRERREIFRGYLSRLERDFHQLHLFARTLVRDQEHDRPELAIALVRTDAEFRWNLLRIRTQLLLEAWHLDVIGMPPVDAKSLVDAAVWMQSQVRLLHAPVAAAPAAI